MFEGGNCLLEKKKKIILSPYAGVGFKGESLHVAHITSVWNGLVIKEKLRNFKIHFLEISADGTKFNTLIEI